MVGKSIYNVWGQSDVDEEWEKIGEILLKSEFSTCPVVDKEVKITHVLAKTEYHRQWMPMWLRKRKEAVFPMKAEINAVKLGIKPAKAIIEANRAELKKLKALFAEVRKNVKDMEERKKQLKELHDKRKMILEEIHAQVAILKEISSKIQALVKELHAGNEKQLKKIKGFQAGWKNDFSQFIIDSVSNIHGQVKEIVSKMDIIN